MSFYASEAPDLFLNFIKSRRSSKLLSKRDVDLSDIKTALSTAISAPSAHNSQPWRFIVITDRSLMERLLDEMALEWRSDLQRDGYDETKIDKIVLSSRERTLRGSLWIIVCLTMAEMDRYPDEKRQRAEYVMAVQSIGSVIQNILLALHALGYGACWRCGPLFAQGPVTRVLKIPEDVEPQGLIEVGGVGGIRAMRRKDLSEVCYLNAWGSKLC
ncbi:MAG: nitroreductase family protein [Aigarchaeota archaeon]|nr:nitroreductase family protein [Aigarchaeota archaeon]MDW8092868.1 nitroreductase family protein [Nitrososphaerota archaeon]